MRLWSDPRHETTAQTYSVRIMDHKPVLVSRNQADKLRQQVIKLRDFLKARRGNNNTVVNSSHRSSHRTRHLAHSLDGGANTALVHVEPFPNDVSKLLAADPLFTCRSFHRCTLPQRCTQSWRQRKPWCNEQLKNMIDRSIELMRTIPYVSRTVVNLPYSK
jgi:hypothetical protein